ncbi:ParB/RepB/Spo0J family partition protein [Nereida sp. MMG025]|uniref:ParB/RepB/Spo0J family partition protein n=1 Tax=Nereida sp. MMG025 TaxID=2909981 RepID=UPI001F219E64|nr:ParB/RepB/Spo0J family partition protein [Nereida sp. MMG025]MCF6446000.1 ParB/RepB/Spo0J family partition protein [Nereida sp. MMG025]
MKKRRVFDINFDDAEIEGVPAGTEPSERRGPMASAIAENADALSERAAAEAAIRAENDALAHELVELKKAGRITQLIPIMQINTDKLTRDRKATRDPEIDELKDSIRQIGLSNPIQVIEIEGGYELIQGYRRWTAFGELYDDTGDDAYKMIPASFVPRGDKLRTLYRRMVDENLVRKGISFGEMAALAWAYVRSSDIPLQNINDAVDDLFASAGRQKRAYIKSFAKMLRRLEGALVHIDVIPRALGLEVAKKLQTHPALVEPFKEKLLNAKGQSAADELAMLRAFVAQKEAKTKPPVKSAKTVMRMVSPRGQIKCTASDGAFSMQSEVDFSALERAKLEAAVAAFWQALED